MLRSVYDVNPKEAQPRALCMKILARQYLGQTNVFDCHSMVDVVGSTSGVDRASVNGMTWRNCRLT
jgi:hypothetical protein